MTADVVAWIMQAATGWLAVTLLFDGCWDTGGTI